MPILKPDIQRVLQAAGLEKADEENLNQLLKSNNLDKETLLDRLRDLIECAENETTRIRALELSFKLHGLLKDQTPAPAAITILIKDPTNLSSSLGVNPVVLPRQLDTSNSDKKQELKDEKETVQ